MAETADRSLDAPMRRIVVTAGQSPLARGVVEVLSGFPSTEFVRGIEARPRGRSESEEGLEIVPFVPDHRPFAEYLEKERIDTVIQCGLVSDRSGGAAPALEADVISTMCLGAAIAREGSPVRCWVLGSSSSIYPIDSHSALLQSERPLAPPESQTLAASIAEAEDYARDVARRLPYLNVAILRLQQLAGGGVRGPLAALLARDPVPTPAGFDPAIQLLHLDDAAGALSFAARTELAGVYNVASAGLMHWHDAVRATGNRRRTVLPIALGSFEPVAGRLGLPFIPAPLVDLLRYGHVLDTRKLEQAGWRPRHDQLDCLKTLAAGAHSRRSR